MEKLIFDEKALLANLKTLTNHGKIFIAYSGGLDSQVLLHALAQIKQHDTSYDLTAVHINHRLNSAANAWADFCIEQCAKLNIPIIVKEITVIKKPRSSLEEVARDLRYREFAALIPPQAYLATAHHADDQIETFFLQLCRGAGVKGLASMPNITQLRGSNSWLIRPMLEFSRVALHKYAVMHSLADIDDDSNNDCNFRRNYLRHEIMPLLKKQYPQLTKIVGRSIEHCQAANFLGQELAIIDYKNSQGVFSHSLSAKKLQELPLARQQNLIRYWLDQLSCRMPTAAQMQQIASSVINSAYSRRPMIRLQNNSIIRIKDNIMLVPYP
jgi:tRNA(Ile)-lysidine synthase